jgi:hypothetical protein
MSSRWFQTHLIRPILPLLLSKWARPTGTLLTLLIVMPVAAAGTGRVAVRQRLHGYPDPIHRHHR